MKLNYNSYINFYTADFETSTDKWEVDKARVWLWDICNTKFEHKTGKNLNDFMRFISNFNKCLFSFHNLAYDGTYILYWLLEHGYIFTPDRNLMRGQFTTIITTNGLHYCYCIKFFNGNTVVINDSLKHNSMSVSRLAEKYNLPIKKGLIDYDLYREIDYEPTEIEKDYIHNDTEIMSRVLTIDIEQGLTAFTESGNARKLFKKTHKNYDELFPEISDEEDAFIRKAYRGGYSYLNPKHKNKIIYEMLSVDINSMYPAQMLHELLPYGFGEYWEYDINNSKIYNEDKNSCVWFIHFTCKFFLKKGGIPTISKKSVGRFSFYDLYMENSNFNLVELTLTNVDFEIFLDNYGVIDLTIIDGYTYRAVKGVEVDHEKAKTMSLDDIILEDGKGSLYYEYLYPLRLKKEHSKGAERENAKKMQNVSYGSQATNRNGELYEPYLNDKGLLSYKKYDGERRKGGYIPIAAMITAHSRKLLISNIKKNINRFVYCDTDSMYLLNYDIPDVPIHDSLYGYFKIEHKISKAKFLGSKRYVYYTTEDSPKDPNNFCVTCCGAPPEVVKQITFENFTPYNKETGGGEFNGKMQQKTVLGGKHLLQTTYKLNC